MVKGFSGLLYAGNKANPGGMFPNGLGISQNIGSIYFGAGFAGSAMMAGKDKSVER